MIGDTPHDSAAFEVRDKRGRLLRVIFQRLSDDQKVRVCLFDDPNQDEDPRWFTVKGNGKHILLKAFFDMHKLAAGALGYYEEKEKPIVIVPKNGNR